MRTFSCLAALLSLVPGLSAPLLADEPTAANSASRCVSIEVLIIDFSGQALSAPAEEPSAEHLLELVKQGKASGVTRMKLATLEGQSGMVQLGEMVGVATGRTFSGRGGGDRAEGGAAFPGATTYTMRNVGTLLSATPTLAQDGAIFVKLTVERSRVGETPAEAERASFAPAKSTTLNTQTNVRVPAGKAVVAGGQSVFEKETVQTFIVVSARVLEGK